MAREPKQRFVALRVNEVSLVDKPANEVEFLVIKRHPITPEAETEMANKTAEQVAAEKKAADEKAAAEKVAAEKATAEAATETDAEKGKKKAPPFVKKPDAEEDDEEEKKKIAHAKEKVEQAMKESIAAAEKTIADASAHVAALKAQLDPAEEKLAEKGIEERSVEKADGTDAKWMLCRMMLDDMHSRLYKMESLMSMDFDSLMATAKAMGVATEKLAEVQKGKKQFSSERSEKLSAAIDNLVDLAKDLDGDRLAKMLAEKGILPSGKPLENDATHGVEPIKPKSSGGVVPPGATGYTASSAVKSDDVVKTVTEAVEPVAKSLEKLSAEIEALKNLRGVSKAIATETTEQPVAKNNFWSGVV